MLHSPPSPIRTCSTTSSGNNSSWYYDGTGVGELLPNPAGDFWDVGVVNSTALLDPQNSILSGMTDPLFVSEYVNIIEATKIIDEGGNNINMRFTPLAGDPMVLSSDYHIADTSPAVDSGACGYQSALTLDFDDDPRPSGAGVDIGADENPAGVAVPPCPADVNGDGVVNILDQILVRNNFGNYLRSDFSLPR